MGRCMERTRTKGRFLGQSQLRTMEEGEGERTKKVQAGGTRKNTRG